MTTAAGAELTRQHQAAQVRNAAAAAAASRAAWALLDVDALDDTAQWLALQLQVMGYFHGLSAQLASGYLQAFKRAETGGSLTVVRGERPPDEQVMTSLAVTGPATVKRHIGRGMPPSAAMRRGFRRMTGALARHVQSGGRQTIERTTESDPDALGWRRVTDGDPCAFCALVASRGPVYGSRADAGDFPGRQYHDACGCTAEPSYGDWEPDEATLRYERIYNESAVSGNYRATLANMRKRMNTN